MFADVFGGTSSASCSNYALRGTAIDKSIFGKAISEALQNNFYAKISSIRQRMWNLQKN